MTNIKCPLCNKFLTKLPLSKNIINIISCRQCIDYPFKHFDCYIYGKSWINFGNKFEKTISYRLLSNSNIPYIKYLLSSDKNIYVSSLSTINSNHHSSNEIRINKFIPIPNKYLYDLPNFVNKIFKLYNII